jgi:hypothetical protein
MQMPDMRWSVNIQVGGGTAMVAAADARPSEAIDTVQVVVSPGDADKVLDIQPGGASAVHLLVIKSSLYGNELSYKASDGTSDAPAVVLDAPHVFSTGSVTLYGFAPRQLKFTNTSTDKTAAVQIFVARDATP